MTASPLSAQKFTYLARQILADAATLATRMGHPEVCPGHILASLFVQVETCLPALCEALGVPFERLEQDATALLDTYPRVTGGGSPRLSPDAHLVLLHAYSDAQAFEDSHISEESLLLGLLARESKAAAVLRTLGFDRAGLIEAVEVVRGGRRIGSPTGELVAPTPPQPPTDGRDTSWIPRFESAWAHLVPPVGHCETLQGELLRIAGRIFREVHNGASNWDEDHETMLAFLVDHLANQPGLTEDEVTDAMLAGDGVLDHEDASRELARLSLVWLERNPVPVPFPGPLPYRR